MYLHKLLKVEESFRDRELVTAAGGSEEVLELVPIWQLQYNFVDFSQRLRVNVLKVFSLQYRLKEQLSDLAHVGTLQAHLRVYLLDLVR